MSTGSANARLTGGDTPLQPKLPSAVAAPAALPEPFYFGETGMRLFGCYHRPQGACRRGCAVLLCHPLGEEYTRFQRLYRQLTRRLSAAGFPVLRFDLSGCGDSEGDLETASVDQWVFDISTAIDETHRRGCVDQCCVLGLRLGGTLATMAAAQRGDVSGLVLWDPVVHGVAYLRELHEMQRAMLSTAHVRPSNRRSKVLRTEALGYPLPDAMRAGLEALDLTAVRRQPAQRILVIESHTTVDQQGLAENLKQFGGAVTLQRRPEPQSWLWVEDVGRVLVPYRSLQMAVRWVSEAFP